MNTPVSNAPASLRILDSLPEEERPQERLEREGPRLLKDHELVALLLRSGSQGNDVLTVAGNLIHKAGGIAGLLRWNADDFCTIKGIGRVKALQLVTVCELARRLQDDGLGPNVDFSHPSNVFTYYRKMALGLEVEKFWVALLNRRNRLLKSIEVSSGIANASVVHAREVFREAIRAGSSRIICVHNHPSGDPSPSEADREVTRQLHKAGELLGIELNDHVVIGEKARDPKGLGFYSFHVAGALR